MKRALTPKIRFQGSFNAKRPFVVAKLPWILLALAVIGGGIYVLFYSQVLAVRTIDVRGFQRLSSDEVRLRVAAMLSERHFFLPTNSDIVFLRTASIEAELIETYPSLNDVSVEKNYPHSITVVGDERIPIGIWCHQTDCVYFDESGATWGKALPSSGALLVTVQDNRAGQRGIASEFLEPIKLVTAELPSLGLSLENVEIPDTYNEFRINVAQGFQLIFALDADVASQLRVLSIFLDKKKSDPTFHPQQYLDLRIAGRVYYK